MALFTSRVIPSLREEDLGPWNSSILGWLPADKQVVVADEGSQCLSLAFNHTATTGKREAREKFGEKRRSNGEFSSKQAAFIDSTRDGDSP